MNVVASLVRLKIENYRVTHGEWPTSLTLMVDLAESYGLPLEDAARWMALARESCDAILVVDTGEVFLMVSAPWAAEEIALGNLV